MLAPLLAIPLIPLVAAASKPSYSIDNLPHTSEEGQTGYNDCGTTDSQSSMCQTVHLNSVTDFCLWAPPTPGVEVGASEEYEVAWCTAAGHGARLMPEGTITSAHYLKTPHYTQITGTGDFTKINIKAGDEGGELDPHGATGLGNPIGSLVFANGQQVKEWTSFISDTEYCIRWCNVNSADDWLWCQHVYDVMGCHWNEPGNYDSGFDTCDAESTQHPPGIYQGTDGKLTTFSQGDGHTPPAMAPGASSNCQAVATVGGNAVAAPAATTSASSAVSSAASSSDVSSSGSVSASSSDSALSSSSFVTSTLSSGASSSALSSGSSTVDPSSAVSSISSGVTVTSTSTLPSASAPVSTAGQQAAASTSSKTNGSARLAAGTLGSLLAVAGAIAFFA